MSTPKFAPFAQGIFYLGTGLWPIVHLRSFEKVTGPKVDTWLVRTLGGLIAAVGAALVVGSFDEKPSRGLAVLGIGSAVALGLADVIFASRGRISKAYYGDAAAEAGVVASWVIAHKGVRWKN